MAAKVSDRSVIDRLLQTEAAQKVREELTAEQLAQRSQALEQHTKATSKLEALQGGKDPLAKDVEKAHAALVDARRALREAQSAHGAAKGAYQRALDQANADKKATEAVLRETRPPEIAEARREMAREYRRLDDNRQQAGIAGIAHLEALGAADKELARIELHRVDDVSAAIREIRDRVPRRAALRAAFKEVRRAEVRLNHLAGLNDRSRAEVALSERIEAAIAQLSAIGVDDTDAVTRVQAVKRPVHDAMRRAGMTP